MCKDIRFCYLLCVLFLVSGKLRSKEYVGIASGLQPNAALLQTKSIQKILDRISKEGGGTLRLTPGTYNSATLFLYSNTTIILEAGAILQASRNILDYPELKQTGHNDRQPYNFLVAEKAENICIMGSGIIDGQGDAFWEPFDTLPRWIKSKPKRISPFLEFIDCKNVRLRDFTVRNSPGWSVHLHRCKQVVADGINILNHLFGPNTDGFDLNGCYDVSINNCHIETCDDAICLKTTPDTEGSARITVSNCTIKTMCAALKLGAGESFKNISQVTFTNCVVYESSRGIGIYVRNGATFEDIVISNIVCNTRAPFVLNRPIHISLTKEKNDTKPIGRIKNVSISNFTAKTEGRILLTADEGSMLENITLRDIRIEYPYIEQTNLYAPGNKSAQFSNNNPIARSVHAALVAENVSQLVVDNFQVIWPSKEIPTEWKIPEKIENGGNRIFHLDYSNSKPVAFYGIWGNHLMGGYLKNPLLQSSEDQLPSVHLEQSTIQQFK